MKYKELSKEDLLLEQIKNLTVLIEQLKINPQGSGKGEGKSKIKDKVEFTKKEIKEMPRLKDFQIRIKDGKYYEIRFRKYGYNMTALRSRPLKKDSWQYYFYIEIDGICETSDGEKMIEELNEVCDKLKVVGTFAPHVEI